MKPSQIVNFIRYRIYCANNRLFGRFAATMFHRYYYTSLRKYSDPRWQGVETWKNPLDLFVYQEIIYRTKPDLIIETGTYKGGSALFMANMCDIQNHGHVVTIDINHCDLTHPRITKIVGDSLGAEVITRIASMLWDNQPSVSVPWGTPPNKRVMVILDSDHSYDHVRKELELYSPLVSDGCYLIVEDTNLNGHPVQPTFGSGPYEAMKDFLMTHKEFSVDQTAEKFVFTFNPHGYLRKTWRTT